MDWVLYGFIFFVFMLVMIWLYIGLYVAMSIVTPKVKAIDDIEVEENGRDASLMPFYHQHLSKEVKIRSSMGYPLYLYEMIQDPDAKKFVVIAHGYTYGHYGSIKYAKMMMTLGYNVLMYDHRFHGKSGGKNSSLGYYESRDLKTVIDYLEDSYGKDLFIGTYGESMGSATCLLEQADDPRVRFIVSDAGFKDLEVLIKHRLKRRKMPPFIFYRIANIFVWLISRSNLSRVKPIEAIKNKDIPIFFVHGKQDDFTPYQHSVDMYESYQGPKHLFLADGQAYHARSYYTHKEAYMKELTYFMKKVVKAD